MALGPGEPPAGPWQVTEVSEFVRRILPSSPQQRPRPWILAIDGRSGSGKSSLASRLAGAVVDTAVVHTDDVAWHHSFFDWSELLIEGVLHPARNGQPVSYQPPGWRDQGRPGAIEVPTGQRLIVVEGVGASRRELIPWIDSSIWVQSDVREAERRGIQRDGGTDAAIAFWHEWMAEENPFLQQDKPWERAAFTVSGTPTLAHDPQTQLVVALPFGQTK